MAPSKHPLDSIFPESDPVSQDEDSAISKIERIDLQSDDRYPGSAPVPPHLSIDSIQSPALLIDKQLRIVWQNSQAVDMIWHRAGALSNGNRSPRLFDQLFDSQFHYHVENWRRWAEFFIQQALCMIPAETLEFLVKQMPERQKDMTSTLMAQHGSAVERHTSRSQLRQVLNDGRIVTYDIVATDFKEGRLTVFEPCSLAEDIGTGHRSYDIEERIEGVRRHPNPIKRSFSVLAANLNNAGQLNLEMIPDEYSNLIHNICRRSIDIIEHYGGIFDKHRESGFFAYFLPLDDLQGNSMRTIECCLELKAEIAELSREWKLRKSWAHDIELNMGLHKAYEHVGILNAYAGEMVVSSGSALSIATNLSNWARGGQIWATKSLFKEMSPDIYKQLRFGIMRPDGKRRQVFIHKCFLAVTELPGYVAEDFDTDGGTENMAATQIFDRQV